MTLVGHGLKDHNTTFLKINQEVCLQALGKLVAQLGALRWATGVLKLHALCELQDELLEMETILLVGQGNVSFPDDGFPNCG